MTRSSFALSTALGGRRVAQCRRRADARANPSQELEGEDAGQRHAVNGDTLGERNRCWGRSGRTGEAA